MKRVGIFLICVAVISSLMILYIYQNIRLIQASYRIRQKENQLATITEEHKKLVFDINAILSPGQLEEKMSQHGITLVQPTEIHVITNMPKLATPALFAENNAQKKPFKILNGIELMPEAHANAADIR